MVRQYIDLQKIDGTNKYIVAQVYDEPKLIQQTDKRLPEGSYLEQACIALCRLLLRPAQQDSFNQDLFAGKTILLMSRCTRFEMGYFSKEYYDYSISLAASTYDSSKEKNLIDDLNAGLNKGHRVSIPYSFFFDRIDKASKQSLERALNYLKKKGAIVWRKKLVCYNDKSEEEYGLLRELNMDECIKYDHLYDVILNSDKFGGTLTYYNRADFYALLRKELKKELGKKVYLGIEITVANPSRIIEIANRKNSTTLNEAFCMAQIVDCLSALLSYSTILDVFTIGKTKRDNWYLEPYMIVLCDLLLKEPTQEEAQESIQARFKYACRKLIEYFDDKGPNASVKKFVADIQPYLDYDKE